MFRYIEQLRGKPEHVRHTSTIVLTVGISVLIVGTWAIVDTPVYLSGIIQSEAEQTQTAAVNEPSPFARMQDTFGKFRDELGATTEEARVLFDAIRSSFATSSQDTAGNTSEAISPLAASTSSATATATSNPSLR